MLMYRSRLGVQQSHPKDVRGLSNRKENTG